MAKPSHRWFNLANRVRNAVWFLIPLAGLVAIWAAHLYYSVSRRPDVLWEDDWVVFSVPGYSRSFDFANIFGTQNDTFAAYQNAVQYLMLVTTNLHMPSYIAVQNFFLLAFVIAVWRLLSSMDFGIGCASKTSAVLAALLLVPVFTGTHHFEGTGMRFNHNMPIVYLALALLTLRTINLGTYRQLIAGCLLFLSGAAYISGWMYMLAATVALVLVRLLAAPKKSPADLWGHGIPTGPTIAGAWIALLAVSAVSVWLSHVPYELIETGHNQGGAPLVWPWDGRFWIFYLITIARGWGLPAAQVWGVIALSASIAPLLALAIRLPRGSRREAVDAFALATPVLGALFALAMVAGGRGLLTGTDLTAVEAHASAHPKYLMHMTFALPFIAAAWMRTIAGSSWLRSTWRIPAVVVVVATHLAGFILGANGSLAERLDFRAIYGRSEAIIRDGSLCLENAVRLARASESGVPVLCPGVIGHPEMRWLVRTAERAGVGSVATITDRLPVSAAHVSALVAEAADTPATGRIDILEIGPIWARIAGRTEMAEDGSYPRWIAVSVPSRPYWLARTTGGTGSNARAGLAGSFDVIVPTGETVLPGAIRTWALYGLSGTPTRAVRIATHPEPFANLLNTPMASGVLPGGSVDAVLWTSWKRELTIRGWALTDSTDDDRRLRFLAPGAVSIVRFTEQERPDVVAAHGDSRLLHSGFTAVLKFAKGVKQPPCVRVWSESQAFGRRALNGPPGRNPGACGR